MDSFYGMSLHSLQPANGQGEVFMASFHKDRYLHQSDLESYLPKNSLKKFWNRQRYQSDQVAMEVQAWAQSQPESAWKKRPLREGDKGKLLIEVLHQSVWVWDKRSATSNRWHLIVRRKPDSPNTLKYSLYNAPRRTSNLELA